VHSRAGEREYDRDVPARHRVVLLPGSVLPAEPAYAALLLMGSTASISTPPRDGPPPPWVAKRPAGVRALLDAFDNCDLDLDALREFERPVYFALGGRSNPDLFGRIAARLAAIFPDFTLEIFSERQHFDPPHRVEPARLAGSLVALWQRAEP
jgi:hypothetical protein